MNKCEYIHLDDKITGKEYFRYSLGKHDGGDELINL
jgi:hypothetical protein